MKRDGKRSVIESNRRLIRLKLSRADRPPKRRPAPCAVCVQFLGCDCGCACHEGVL